MPRRIQSLFINGPAGQLEALLEEPEHEAPRSAALVCHPHPQHGGTMHNKVVYRIARALRNTGSVVLRFNYRGVNLSQGEYGHGEGELEDARAALSVLVERYPQLPVILAGFSFGSRIVLRLGCSEPAERIIAVGYPTSYPNSSDLGRCDVPRVFIQSTHDQFGPVASIEQYFQTLKGEKLLLFVKSKDHFFAGALDAFEEAVASVGDVTRRLPDAVPGAFAAPPER
jgi:alpha/beta superfamily hydrolase